MIGILCGLKSEAKLADRIPDVLVGVSAARPERARALAQHMAEQGATRLVSFGLAGAVSPDLVAGDLLLGATVMAARDGCWEADAAWQGEMVERLPHALCVAFWGSDRMATLAKDKGLIYRRTGCMAVDMESHIVAETAASFRIPFSVVRAVSDTAALDLPPAALVPLKEDGGVDARAVWASLRQDKGQLADLMQLALGTRKAMKALRHAVDVMRELG